MSLRSRVSDVGLVAGEASRLGQLLVGLLGVSIDLADAGGHVEVALEPAGDGVALGLTRSGRHLQRHEWEWSLDRLGDDAAAVLGSQRLAVALFVARQIAGLHGGRLEPSEGEGESRLVLLLPRGRGPDAPVPSRR